MGKTTLAEALEARQLEGVGVSQFDRVGVPTLNEMTERHGSPEAWQRDTLDAWVDRLAGNPDAHRCLRVHGVEGQIVLVDCDPDARSMRLSGRGQPELATPDMDRWAAYLKGQADALELVVIDTTHVTVGEATDALEDLVREMMKRNAG